MVADGLPKQAALVPQPERPVLVNMPAGDLRPLEAVRFHEERGYLQLRLQHFDAGACFEKGQRR